MALRDYNEYHTPDVCPNCEVRYLLPRREWCKHCEHKYIESQQLELFRQCIERRFLY